MRHRPPCKLVDTYHYDNTSTVRGARSRQVSTTHTDVALSRQQYCQPDTGRMKHSRQVINEAEVDITPAVRYPVILGTGCEEPDVHRQWPQTRQRVGESYGDEHSVGRCTHVTSDQHDAHEQVADDGDEDKQRNNVAVDERAVRDVIQKER